MTPSSYPSAQGSRSSYSDSMHTSTGYTSSRPEEAEDLRLVEEGAAMTIQAAYRGRLARHSVAPAVAAAPRWQQPRARPRVVGRPGGSRAAASFGRE